VDLDRPAHVPAREHSRRRHDEAAVHLDALSHASCMADRAQLEGWIAETQRNRQRMRKAITPAAVVAIALVFVSRPIGLGAILLVALVGVLGEWITASHILDWRTRIAELDKPKPVGRALKRRESD
jgi:hypothetical protein